MKNSIKLLFFCLCVITAFASCKRGINADDILTMEEGASRDSAICYYSFGFYLNQPLQAVDTFSVSKEPYNGEKSARNKIDFEGKTYSGDIMVLKGDTLIPTNIFVYHTGKETNILWSYKQVASEVWSIKFKIIRDGKPVDEGWNTYDMHFVKDIAPFAWTAIFHDWDAWVASFIFFGGFLVLIHRLWLWIYRKIQKRRQKPDITRCGLKLHFVFVGFSFLIAVMCIYFAFNASVVSNLYYNPNMIIHWSEYPFVVKLFPFLLLLFVATMVGMFIEMMKKMKSAWFIIHFIGWFALGCFTIGMTLLASWLFYIMICSILPFFIYYLFSNNSLAKAAAGGSGKSIVGYNASGQAIREGEGGSVAHRSWSDYVDKR